MLRLLPFLVVVATACGAGESLPGPPQDALLVSPMPGNPVADAAESGSNPWIMSSRLRALDGLSNVLVLRYPDEVTGAPPEDAVLMARCLGDRTEVEIEWGVLLGDDVYQDETGTKRSLVRFSPNSPTAVVWDVGNNGTSLVVDEPARFLRDFVTSLEVLIQTTSWNGTVLFAQFLVAEGAQRQLDPVADACGWILDPEELEAAERRDAATLYAAERQRVLETYLGSPLRDDLEYFGVVDEEVYINLPAPVHRAYLGFGVSINDVHAARALGRGIICLSGSWVADEIVLNDCYLEDTLDVDLVEGLVGAPAAPPPPSP